MLDEWVVDDGHVRIRRGRAACCRSSRAMAGAVAVRCGLQLGIERVLVEQRADLLP